MARKIQSEIVIIAIVTWILLTPSKLIAANPQLKFQLKSTKVSLGDNFTIEIQLDTFNQSIVGVDAIINFEPRYLKAFRIDPGSLFPNYPGLYLNNQEGVIKLAGSSNFSQYFSGKGILATLNFEALSEGETTIAFQWEPNSTRETNIVSPQKTDLLVNEPDKLQIKIIPSNSPTNQVVKDPTSTNHQEKTEEPTPTPIFINTAEPITGFPQILSTTNRKEENQASSPLSEQSNYSTKKILGEKDSLLTKNKKFLFRKHFWEWFFLGGLPLLIIFLSLIIIKKGKLKLLLTKFYRLLKLSCQY